MGIVPVFPFLPSVLDPLPTGQSDFFPLFSELPRARCCHHGRFFSGLSVAQGKGRHKAVVHRKEIPWHKSSITVFIVQVCEESYCGGCKDRCHGCPALHCRTGPLALRGTTPLAEGHQQLWCHSASFS